MMVETKKDLFTVGKIAEELNISPAKIKKALFGFDIQPTQKMGFCNYYSKEVIDTLKKVIK
jgi:hypothetical protein